MTEHGLTGTADAGAFLARLVRLDRSAPVRLRSIPVGTALWAPLPWEVLVTRLVAGPGPGDATVSAAELLAALERGSAELPTRRDERWRWPVPPAAGGTVVETVAVAELLNLAGAAAEALREAETVGVSGRPVGQRAVRDALLDHIALTVPRTDDEPVRVPQRLVQAVYRMGFLGSGPAVRAATARIGLVGRWIAISAPYGTAWLPSAMTLTIMRPTHQPNG